MGLTNFPNGITSFGIPVVGAGPIFTTGNIFFVDDGGSNDNDGKSPEVPFATLDYAIGQCTATNGDHIVVMPGHAETTTAIAADVAGITIVGIGNGRARPTFTATTGASDLIDVTAANVTIKNIRLIGAASGCTSLISIAANDFACEHCSLEQAATPLLCVNVTHGYDRFRFSDCMFLGTAAGPDVAIDLTGSGDTEDFIVERCDFNYLGSAGLDLAGIRSSKIDTGVRISDCRFIGMDATALDFNSAATGIVERVSVLSLSSTAAEMIDAGSLGFVDCRVAYAAQSGALIPATTCTP